MLNKILVNFISGFKRIREHPQLGFTLFVAIAILFSYFLVADRFISIAKDAEDRLINVRIGSIHDVFVKFVPEHIDNIPFITSTMSLIANENKTIKEFKIIKVDGEDEVILASISGENKNERNQSSDIFLYNLALTDPKQSFTVEESKYGERFFRTARAIKNSDGTIFGVVVTSQTLSEADKRIDENIRQSLLVFILIVIFIMFLFFRHSKIIDYISLYKRLKEVDELKDDFISMASHELRTPLTVIRGYTELIGDAPELSADTKANLKKIDMAAMELNNLVEDILDVSRIEQGRMQYNFKEFDPSSIVQTISTSFEFTAKSKDIKISSEVKGSGKIKVDENKLKQILINIIGNAVKYTKDGEVKVSVGTEHNRLIIRVSDSGIGMKAEDQKKIFEKFYRIQNKDTENIPGSGLGLWITEAMIKEMNGSISVESIMGVGSHFIISFPLTSK